MTKRKFAAVCTALVVMMPGLSYRINEKLFIGAAANVMIGYLNYSAAINNRAFLNVPDGNMRMTDTTVGAGGAGVADGLS
jgi:hypothetical protein